METKGVKEVVLTADRYNELIESQAKYKAHVAELEDIINKKYTVLKVENFYPEYRKYIVTDENKVASHIDGYLQRSYAELLSSFAENDRWHNRRYNDSQSKISELRSELNRLTEELDTIKNKHKPNWFTDWMYSFFN